jgi:hypothetical protein
VLVWYQGPQFVHIDGRVPMRIGRQVEAAHTDLTEVTGMVFIKVRSESTRNLVNHPQRIEIDDAYR